MKKTIFILLVILTAQPMFAQPTQFQGEISWSQLFPVNRKVSAPNIIGQDGEHVYLSPFCKKKKSN
jgi:hypothetical protein